MKARVSTLYRKGRQLPRNKVGSTVVGDLNLSAGKHPVTGVWCVEAVVLTDAGLSLLPDLSDVQCLSIAAFGFRLRGIESNCGREMAQEWWCVPLLETHQESK
jgi:hypothetical protein